MLRLAHLLLEEHSIQVAAPVHDAFLILCRERELAVTAQETRRVMVYASEYVLGHPLRVEMQLLRWPDRLLDPRGSSTWSQIAQILGVREHGPGDSFNQNVTVPIR